MIINNMISTRKFVNLSHAKNRSRSSYDEEHPKCGKSIIEMDTIEISISSNQTKMWFNP